MTETRIRNHTVETISEGFAPLRRHEFELLRRDGTWDRQLREIYERDDAAAVLPYDPGRGTVLLVRQFRMPVHVRGDKADLVETCAGLLEGQDPETCIRREAEEELGLRLREVARICDVYLSPGGVTERSSLFVATYEPADRIGHGGGADHEGEDIEVLELPFDEALAMIRTGAIVDGKTIMLLQHIALEGLIREASRT
jgi:nudix-type nucleoside diphosphatase (YffH/AdpP family)